MPQSPATPITSKDSFSLGDDQSSSQQVEEKIVPSVQESGKEMDASGLIIQKPLSSIVEMNYEASSEEERLLKT